MSLIDAPYHLPIAASRHDPIREWVVFADSTDIRFLRFLRRGFRHCFYVRRERGVWSVMDPLAHCTVMTHYTRDEIGDLIGLLAGRGLTAVPVKSLTPPHRLAPPMLCTCVEMVKRIIGLHRAWVITPYQLYRHITKQSALSTSSIPLKGP